MPNKRLRSYHLDVGNSSVGPIGLCARVWARSKKEALTILRQRLPEMIQFKNSEVEPPMNQRENCELEEEYIHVYLSGQNLSTRDIDTFDND